MASKKSQRGANTKDLRMRQQLAHEAARLIAEEGIKDFQVAKQKAALRLHAPQTHNLPRNNEIQAALNEYQRIFKADTQPQHLHRLRQISRRAMAFFESFEPRLVGAVLDGSANEHSEITLHLFCDSQEELGLCLLNQNIPFEHCSQKVNMPNGESIEVPGYRLVMENAPVLLLVFNRKGLRQAPRCPATGKPMQRLSLNKVEELIQLSG
jgi:hypothetical protein